MTSAPILTLFHSPNTRSTGTLLLLEELGAPYELRVIAAGRLTDRSTASAVYRSVSHNG